MTLGGLSVAEDTGPEIDGESIAAAVSSAAPKTEQDYDRAGRTVLRSRPVHLIAVPDVSVGDAAVLDAPPARAPVADVPAGVAPAIGGRARSAARQLVGLDLVAALAAVLVAMAVRFGNGPVRPVDLVAAALLPPLWLAAAARHRAYDVRFAGIGTAEFARTARAFADLLLVVAGTSYCVHLELARGFVLVALPLTLAASWTARWLARARLRRLRRAGEAMNRVLAVGSVDSVLALATAMHRDVYSGLHVVGACLADDRFSRDPAAFDDAAQRLAEAGIPVVGTPGTVPAAARRCGAASVAVAAGDVAPQGLRSVAWQLEGSGIDLIVGSGLTEVADRRVHVQTVAGLPMLRVDEPTFRGFRPVLKAVFDRVVAGLLLIMLAPVLLALGLLVRMTSPGPALYRQVRIGRGGAPFRMLKFRSMRVGADRDLAHLLHLNEAGDGPLFKMADDPRVTRLGKLLRRFSLDELPQLVNVLTGSMSLVGPRPPLPGEVADYDADVRRRLLVKPGLTGLWQVNGRSDLPWTEAVRLDLHYVENWSLWLDLVVLAKTVRAVVRPSGAY